MLKFDLPKGNTPIIKVIGVGGGGSNAVAHMFKQGIKGVDFFICNTDAQSLNSSVVPNKIILGSTGLGAGSVPAVGREAALKANDEIKNILTTDTSMLFITAGMGGGTGTGAAPVIAQAARELGILTVGIVTKPFGFEGRKRAQQAIAGIEELKKHVDATLVICNDKLLDMQGDLKLSQAFSMADDVLTIAAKGIAEIITVEGRVNVDFEDINTVMKGSGKAIMGAGIASGQDRAVKAVEMAMNSPLLDDTDVRGADNVLLYITSGKEEITLEELNDITGYITERTGETANVIWGDGTDERLGDEIAITLIATGFDKPFVKKHILESSQNTHLENEQKKDSEAEIKLVEKKQTKTTQETYIPANTHINPIANIWTETPKASAEMHAGTLPDFKNIELNHIANIEEKVNNVLGQAINLTSQFTNSNNAQIVQNADINGVSHDMRVDKLRKLSHDYRNPALIEELEKVPAYVRQNLDLFDNVTEQVAASRYAVNVENTRHILSENNPFLHDRAD